MKAIATTNISFGLLNLPVAVVQATEKGSDISFKMCSPSGQPLTQHYSDASGNTYTRGSANKGLERGDKTIAVVNAADLKAIEDSTKINGLVVEEFTPAIKLWERAHRINGHYYVQMVKKGGNANVMKLFVNAMERKNLCAIVKWTPRTRQEQLVLHAKDGVLHAYAVEFANDVREPDEQVTAHNAGTYSDAEMAMAEQLIAALTNDEPETMDTMKDEAIDKRHALAQQLLSGQAIPAPTVQVQQEANAGLAEALAASLAALKSKDKVLA